jgi:outer membrane protein assembly factor BamB
VDLRLTTICCSAAALILACTSIKARDIVEWLSPFPAQQAWTLSLNGALVAAPAYDGPFGYFSIEDDRIAAYDLSAGTPHWVTSARSVSTPAIGDALLFVAERDALTALRIGDGSVAWKAPWTGTPASRLAVAKAQLVATTDTELLAFGTADGMIRWRHDTASPARAAPAVAADRIYVPLDDGRVIAVRSTDGGRLWERRLGAAANDIRALDDRLFVGSADDFLYCLSAENGQIRWRWRTGGDVIGVPIVDERRVYFVALDNVLRALNQRTGVQQWKQALSFRPVSGPVRAADTLIVSGLAGPAQAFLLKDGAPAGTLSYAAGVELAAPLHVFTSPTGFAPTVVAVTSGVAVGATVAAYTRSIEPPLIPALQPLPGVLPVTIPTSR